MSAPAPPARAAAAEPAQEEKKSGKMLKLIALGLIAAVIGGECLAAFMFLASTDGDSASKGAAAHGKSGDAVDDSASDASKTGEEGADESTAPLAIPDDPADKPLPAGASSPGDFEVDLGQFSLTVYQPTSGTTLLVDFHLYGTIKSKETAAFDERFEKHKHRIRDQVIITIRSAEMADFADPGLGLIKRQILAKSNALLGKRLLRSVMFSDFTFIEQ